MFWYTKSIFSDSLLVITQEQGMFIWFNNSLVGLMDPDVNPLNDLKLFHSIRLSDGYLALSTNRKGVFIINEKGVIVRNNDLATRMLTNDIQSMFEDRDQNLWLEQ